MDDLYTPSGSDGLSLAERARLGCLPDELSIYELSLLIAPDNPSEQRTWQNVLLKLAQEGKLAVAHGDTKGWSYWEGTVHVANPYPRCEAHVGWTRHLGVTPTSSSPLARQKTFEKEGYPPGYKQATQVAGQACLIHRDALKACVDAKQLPLPHNNLLAQGWPTCFVPVPEKLSIDQIRDQCLESYITDLEQTQGIDRNAVPMSKAKVHAVLREKYPTVFPFSLKSFTEYWRFQKICKLKAGRSKGG